MRDQNGYIIVTPDIKVSGNIENYSNLDRLNIADNSHASITNQKGGYIGTLNVGVRSTATINNQGCIDTINTEKGSSLVIDNYGTVKNINIGEDASIPLPVVENVKIFDGLE